LGEKGKVLVYFVSAVARVVAVGSIVAMVVVVVAIAIYSIVEGAFSKSVVDGDVCGPKGPCKVEVGVDIMGESAEGNGDGILLAFFTFSGDFGGVPAFACLILNPTEEKVIYLCCFRGCVTFGEFKEAPVSKGNVELFVIHPNSQ
jgi:hypothetical protein